MADEITLVESLIRVGRSKDPTCNPSKWLSRAAARYCCPNPGLPRISRRGRKIRDRSNSRYGKYQKAKVLQ